MQRLKNIAEAKLQAYLIFLPQSFLVSQEVEEETFLSWLHDTMGLQIVSSLLFKLSVPGCLSWDVFD